MFIALLAAENHSVCAVGFDADPDAIAQARAMASAGRRQHGTADVRFEHLHAQSPWPAGEYDVVAMIDVMHHIPPAAQRAVFQEALSHVAPGGVLIYKDMCRRPLWRAGMNRLHDLVVARQWIHYLPIEHVDRWAAAAGMATERADAINRLWYGHELRVLRRPAAPSGSSDGADQIRTTGY